ncbi:MAG: hypothetical protein WA364_11315 [Candidatus Nitrosopolaris sp.]
MDFRRYTTKEELEHETEKVGYQDEWFMQLLLLLLLPHSLLNSTDIPSGKYCVKYDRQHTGHSLGRLRDDLSLKLI